MGACVSELTQHKQSAEDTTAAETQIELEYRRQLFRHAAEIVRQRADETTWLAFQMTMIDGASIADAATRLGRSEGVIYAARSRIIKRLKDVVKELESDPDE